MTGDAPQPGTTPRSEGRSWSLADPDAAWWRTAEEHRERDGEPATAVGRPRRRTPASGSPSYGDGEPAYADEAVDAHAAGVHDAADALVPPAPAGAVAEHAGATAVGPAAPAEPVASAGPVASAEPVATTEEGAMVNKRTAAKETAETSGPPTVKEPAAPKGSSRSRKSAALKKPARVEESTSTEEPTPAKEPVTAQEPPAVQEPTTVQDPPVVQVPPTVQEPAAVGKPASVEDPAGAQELAGAAETTEAEATTTVEDPPLAEEPDAVERDHDRVTSDRWNPTGQRNPAEAAPAYPGNAPSRDETAPGRAGTAPGRAATAPGRAGTAPGHAEAQAVASHLGTAPGHIAAASEAAPEAAPAQPKAAQDHPEALQGEIIDARPTSTRDSDRTVPHWTHQPTEELRTRPASRTAAAATGSGDPGGEDGVPEVMILPEPSRNRPTVALDRTAVPGQPSGASRLGRRTLSDSAREAARERMENSPFWLSEEERAAAGAAWPAAATRDKLAGPPPDGRRGKPPVRRPRRPRAAAPGLLGLVALGLIAAFFAWVSAEPFWLAAGHGTDGRATVSRCTGSGVTQRCLGSFAAGGDRFTVGTVTLLGVDAERRAPGSVSPARMVSADSRQAYVGDTGLLVNLRWVLGFILVLLCGYGIAGLTGARQLETARARRGAVLISLAGPLLLLLGFLAAAY